MKNWLLDINQPFPFLHQKKHLVFWLLELFVLVTLFEYFIEPFQRNYNEHLYNYWIICMFHAGIVVICYTLFFIAIQYTSDAREWTIKDEFKYLVLLLFLVGLGGFLVRDLIYNTDNWSWRIFEEEMIHGVLAGALFYFLVINLNRQLLGIPIPRDKVEIASTIKIAAQVAADSFEVDPKDIVLIKADGNYAIFYLYQNQSVKEKMIRQTLESLEEHLREYDDFLRTHRAFIINHNFIDSTQGNSGGYQLTIKHLDFKVPVSRSNVKKFDALNR